MKMRFRNMHLNIDNFKFSLEKYGEKKIHCESGELLWLKGEAAL